LIEIRQLMGHRAFFAGNQLNRLAHDPRITSSLAFPLANGFGIFKDGTHEFERCLTYTTVSLRIIWEST
jgi:hypothetical protein